MADARTGDECDAATRFQAGSISKQFVATAAMLLVERNQLELHVPIGRWLLDVPAAWREITLNQLLSHSSGLGHWSDIVGLDVEAPISEDHLIELAAHSPLLFPPGEKFHYSGLGYLVVARLIQAVADLPYDAFVREHLLVAAGLGDTTSGRFPIGEPGVARGHHAGVEVEVREHLSRLFGTGDLWTTVGDLCRWTSSLHEAMLIDADSVATMMSEHVQVPPPEVVTHVPIVTARYGYGARLGTVLGHTALFHTGDNPGYNSIVAWIPRTATAVAVLTNDDGRDLAEPLQQIVAPALR